MIALHITVCDLDALKAAADHNLYNAGAAWRGRNGIQIKKATMRKLRALGLITTMIVPGVQERAQATGDGLMLLALARRNGEPRIRLAIAGGRPAKALRAA